MTKPAHLILGPYLRLEWDRQGAVYNIFSTFSYLGITHNCKWFCGSMRLRRGTGRTLLLKDNDVRPLAWAMDLDLTPDVVK